MISGNMALSHREVADRMLDLAGENEKDRERHQQQLLLRNFKTIAITIGSVP